MSILISFIEGNNYVIKYVVGTFYLAFIPFTQSTLIYFKYTFNKYRTDL